MPGANPPPTRATADAPQCFATPATWRTCAPHIFELVAVCRPLTATPAVYVKARRALVVSEVDGDDVCHSTHGDMLVAFAVRH